MTRRRSAAWTPGLLVTAVAAAHLLGCASLSGPGVTYVDYAHADQGATVITSGRDGSRTGAGLINGVSDSNQWAKGEGWQVTWERKRYKQGWSSWSAEDRLSRGAAWAEIRLDRPRRINRVVIHGLDTPTHPFEAYKEGALQVRRAADLPGMWTTIGRIENHKVIVPGRRANTVSGKTTFRFNTTEVDAVRFIVYEMSGATTSDQQTYATRSQTNTISLLEIEVTGTEAVDPITAPLATVAYAPESVMDGLKGPGLNPDDDAVEDVPSMTRTVGAAVGDGAPPFQLVDLNGAGLDLEDYRGQVVLLNFWATWCAPCVREIPDLVQLSDEMASQGVAVLGISVDSTDPAQVKAFADRYSMDYPVAIVDRGMRRAYGGVTSIPTTFIIDADGVITEKIVGMQSKEMFKRYVEQALAN